MANFPLIGTIETESLSLIAVTLFTASAGSTIPVMPGSSRTVVNALNTMRITANNKISFFITADYINELLLQVFKINYYATKSAFWGIKATRIYFALTIHRSLF